jgi:hypothetical protein
MVATELLASVPKIQVKKKSINYTVLTKIHHYSFEKEIYQNYNKSEDQQTNQF